MSDETLDTLLNVIIIAGIAVLIFNIYSGYDSNYTEEEYRASNMSNSSNISSTIQTYVPKTTKSLNTSLEQINISLATEDDKKLIILIVEGDNVLREDISKAVDAAKKEDYKTFETSGIIIKKDSKKYLDKINEINTSSSFDNLFKEYKQTLDSFYKAGKYIETGSRNPLSEDIDKSIKHMNDGKVHMGNIYYIMKLNRSELNKFILNINISSIDKRVDIDTDDYR